MSIEFGDRGANSILSIAHPFPIRGFRMPGASPFRTKSDVPESYPTVEHFYHSEKFRTVDERLRLQVIAQPTAREAYKLAMRSAGSIRSDWVEIQEQVLWCGLSFRYMQDREFRLALSATQGTDLVYRRNSELKLGRSGQKGDNLVGKALAGLRDSITTAPIRLLVCGNRNLKEEALVNEKLDFLFSQKTPYVLVCPGEPGGDTLGENWARNRYIPVRYVPLRQTKMKKVEREENMEKLARYITHLVVFTTHESKNLVSLVKRTKELSTDLNKKHVRVIPCSN